MKRIVWLVIGLALVGCQTYESGDTTRIALDDQQLQDKRTALLIASDAKVIFDNDRAFEAKLSHITNATQSVDMVYPTIANDYSTSLLVRTLLAVTERGVDVRLLVDYQKGYRQLAFLSMLEHWGNQGEGSLEVRLFNRPNKAILRDALLLDVCYQQSEACNKERLAWVDQQIERGELNPGAALLLSGVAADYPGLIGVALEQDALAPVQDSIRAYFKQGYGLADAMATRELSQTVLASAEIALPLSQQLAEGLPAKAGALSPDWAYASTDILHHQLLLVDGLQLQLGRALQDAYHLKAHALSEPYTFISWDVSLTLGEPSLALNSSIDQLWNASFSVALSEIREQIPDATTDAINQAIALCRSVEDQQCLVNSATRLADQPLSEKIYGQYQKMEENAQWFEEHYQATAATEEAVFIDANASIHYLENLPYYQDGSRQQEGKAKGESGQKKSGGTPTYGALNGEEAAFGKSVHAVLLPAMRAVCESASPQLPKEVVIVSGDFLLPSNMLTELAQMSDGRIPCANVSINILGNSAENATDPVAVLLARTVMEALLVHQSSRGNSAQGAKITYYESAAKASDATILSINANLFVLGDDVFIGSTTADVRGFMANTSSGLYIQNSPGFISRLNQWLNTLKSDDKRFTQHSASSLRAMKRETNQVLNGWLAKQSVSAAAKQPKHLAQMKESVRVLLKASYDLSKKIVSHHGRSKSQQLELNRLFSVK